ncbi:BlaI/MecI/CopY family transcriptional regulator [Paenibacillus sp. MMS18-CY102]|uniref:BlaI/MecI/CopY family transcriptional regulator n=1 Tax=Paenibacillus sp. MMS18-CY102 TaxID=2682849 RepID=UPI001365D77E|nr:BlaI/MecI/CopY family transcriptional regulator [Paenibacillus sp. MMS18-CY102]MWC27582.1 BlaI/MecI/CopY family transcriptional regulator [Paenibacillus sp. MMS18-CY102]
MTKISEAEREIMEIIWKYAHPMTTAEILQVLPDGKWKQSTVITFLARLMDKGFVTATRIGKANHYQASMTESAYRAIETKQFIRDVHQGSVSGLISALCDTGELNKEDIEELIKRLRG